METGARTGTSRPAAADPLAPREDDGLVIVDADRRVRLLDHRARELLAGMLALGDTAPALLLTAGSIVLQRADEDPAPGGTTTIELRVRSSKVDGRDGWAIGVADVSGRTPPQQEASEFVSAVCHEMRTPLTGILGYADALRQGWEGLDPDRRNAFLDIIVRQGRRLTRLTADLAALSRPGRGLDVQPEAVPLDRAVADTLAVLREDAEGVEVVGDVGVGLTVRVDPSHLENILINLVSNARKYGRAPFVVELERQDLEGVVRVRDSGDGVPAGFAHRMWDRFARARADERPAGAEGSGLGLAVVASLASVNGGHVWYEPNVPTGAAFCVAFPLAGSDREAGRDPRVS